MTSPNLKHSIIALPPARSFVFLSCETVARCQRDPQPMAIWKMVMPSLLAHAHGPIRFCKLLCYLADLGSDTVFKTVKIISLKHRPFQNLAKHVVCYIALPSASLPEGIQPRGGRAPCEVRDGKALRWDLRANSELVEPRHLEHP